ncbi:MAG: EAL domain-containing protein [Halothiobacillus sp.]
MTLPPDLNAPLPSHLRPLVDRLVERLERQHALLQSLLGQIGVLISATDEQELLHVVCTQLLASGLFISAWVGQANTQNPEQFTVLASGGDGQRVLDQLSPAQSHALTVQVSRAQFLDQPTIDEAPDSPLATAWQAFAPEGWKCTTFLIPIHRHNVPWAVLIVIAPHEDVLESLLGGTLKRLGELLGNALAQFDLRQRLQDEHEQSAYLAHHDALTGLANRHFLGEELPKAMARARRNKQSLAVVMLDLDEFKPVNDRWGHAVGDVLLKTLSQRLSHVLRGTDLAARQGGDEFILLIEGIERKKQLTITLERLNQILDEPYALPKGNVRVQTSMGITLFPQDDGEPEQLIRHADAALYVCKNKKRERKKNWCLWNEHTTSDLDAPLNVEPHTLAYGAAAGVLLETLNTNIQTLTDEFITYFYQELAIDPESIAILQWLDSSEYTHLKQRQAEHLRQLLDPELTEATHRANARRVGEIHAFIGLSASSLVRGMTVYLHQFVKLLITQRLSAAEHNRLELILTERLSIELSEQLEAEQSVNNHYQKILTDVDALSRQALSWQEFNEQLLVKLCECPGMCGAWIGSPDPEGVFIINFKHKVEPFIEAIHHHYGELRMPNLSSDRPEFLGATTRAFRFGQIHSTDSFSTNQAASAWREAAQSVGIRSSIGIPILDDQRRPLAVLTLYGAYPGLFETAFRQSICQQLGFIISQAWQQVSSNHTISISTQELDQWRQAFYTHGLTFVYQPIMNLQNGLVEKVEALARLQLADGRTIMPGAFISRLNDSQIILLFKQGLEQGLSQLSQWDGQLPQATELPERIPAYPLGLSLNLPLEALAHPECTQWVADALKKYHIPAVRLTLEVLEHHEMQELERSQQQMHALVALGVTLAMDDLGAGYSNLIRLNNLPFDTVKIDQALIRSAYDDPLRIIKFISVLIHMTHALDLIVVAEGLEHPDLIEAVRILGADMGQGYAIAHPLPPEQFTEWLRTRPPLVDTSYPRTPLGAMAIHWRMVNYAIPMNQMAGEGLANNCPVNRFIIEQQLEGSALDAAHRALHAAEHSQGPHNAEVYQLLHQVQALLAELVVNPEAAA